MEALDIPQNIYAFYFENFQIPGNTCTNIKNLLCISEYVYRIIVLAIGVRPKNRLMMTLTSPQVLFFLADDGQKCSFWAPYPKGITISGIPSA